MKKLNYLWMLGLLMFAAVNFSACSSSDDEEKVLGSSSELVGLWESVSMEGWTKLNGEIYDGVEMENEKVRIKFNADGTWIGYEFNEGEWETDSTGSWDYENGKLYLTEEQEEDSEEDDEAFVSVDYLTVKELTSSRLVLEVSLKEDYAGMVYEVYACFTMKKI